jgi:catechol 2,3-dioxygenase-like lactoylglutathione lyase family enzyme
MKKFLSACLPILAAVASFGQQNATNDLSQMEINQIYTVFITNKLDHTVKFYEHYFGFTKVFESTFFVLLQTTGDQKFSIAFMDENHPTAPPTPPRYNGSGSFLTLEVSDARAVFDEMSKRRLKISYQLTEEPWGQRRFGVVDPNGLWIDVVEQIQPHTGYWEKYIKN